MKVVLDTNVLISGLFWRGFSKKILALAKENRITICVNREIVVEFERVLNYPKLKNALAKIAKTPAEIMVEFLEIVEFYPSYFFDSPQVISDPDDDKFLSCALTAGAYCIVSGDKHLVNLGEFEKIPIFTPRQFFDKFHS